MDAAQLASFKRDVGSALTKLVLKDMIILERGKILFTSSVAAFVIAGSWKNKIQANIAKIAPQKAAAAMRETMTKPNSPLDR